MVCGMLDVAVCPTHKASGVKAMTAINRKAAAAWF